MTQTFNFDWKAYATIGIEQINELIQDIYSHSIDLDKSYVVNIELSPFLEIVDELFVAYMVLINLQNSNVKFKIFINHALINGKGSEKVNKNLYKLRQLIGNIGFLTKQPIEIIGLSHKENKPKSYLPVFPIKIMQTELSNSRNLKKFLFNNQIDLEGDSGLFSLFIKEKDELLKKISNQTEFKKILLKKSPLNFEDIIAYTQIDFLSKLKILRYSFLSFHKIQNEKQNSIVSNLRVIQTYDCLFESGFFELNPYQFFILNTIIFNNDEIKVDLNELKDQISFVKKISIGIKELVDNVIEHSDNLKDNGKGTFSGKVYSKTELNEIKNYGDAFNDYLINTGDYGFLEININDFGEKSLRQKFKEGIQNQYKFNFDENSKKELQDILILENSISIYDFLDFTNLKLNHQTDRFLARMGLLNFSRIILKERNGFIKIANFNNEENQTECYSLFYLKNKLEISTIPPYKINQIAVKKGLSISCIIPIQNVSEVYSKTQLPSEPNVGVGKSVFKPLFSIFSEMKTYFHSDDNIKPFKDKYEKNFKILTHLKELNKKIIIINANNFYTYTSSDWIRFFASYQLAYKDYYSLIILDLRFDIYLNIISILSRYDNFWFKDTPILFYFKKVYNFANNKNRKLSLWFNHVIYGDTIEGFKNLNQSLTNYHFNLNSIVESFSTNDNYKDEEVNSNIFFENKLLNFELLLKDYSSTNNTFFEESVLSLLNLEIENPIESIENESHDLNFENKFYSRFKGFRISNSHFKLGSKIHIEDFYYAKRLFYNSFYANRFAFLIASEIKNTNLRNPKDEVTLIGYNYYSELLVNGVREFLNEDGYENINHDILLDNEKLLKSRDRIKNNVIIIIPISSTFSTSEKLKRNIESLMKVVQREVEVLNPFYSSLFIADIDFEKSKYNLSIPYNLLKWEEKEFEKNLKTKNIFLNISNKTLNQKFSLGLSSKWYSNYECPLCFPYIKEKIGLERCMLETEKNNVTPFINFDFPVFKDIKDRYNSFLELIIPSQKPNNNDYFVISRELVKKINHNSRFFFRSGRFNKNNSLAIKKWLETLKLNEITNNKNLIVSPSVSSNSGFLSLTNETLFNSTATILKFNPQEDNIYNFAKFHKSLLQDSYIIFVDDVISSATSFNAISNYIEITLPNAKINQCVLLINRLSKIEEDKIKKYLPEIKIDAFIKFNSPELNYEDKKGNGQLTNYYKDLSKKSSLDLMRTHFLTLAKKSRPLNLDERGDNLTTDSKSLLYFLIFQEISIFFNDNFNKINNLEQFFIETQDQQLTIEKSIKWEFGKFKLNLLLSKINSTSSIKKFLEVFPEFKFEIDNLALNILTQEPFVLNKYLKEALFDLVIKKLETHTLIDEITPRLEIPINYFSFLSEKNHNIAFSKFQEFKLILLFCKRLKINQLYFESTLRYIEKLLERIQMDNDSTTLKNEKGINTIYPIGFSTYYVGLLQEIISEDEAKAHQLISIIWGIINQERDKYNLRSTIDSNFINLLRLLVFENIYALDSINRIFTKEFQSEYKSFEEFREMMIDFMNHIRFEAAKKTLTKFGIENKEIKDEKLLNAFYYASYIKQYLIRETSKDNKVVKDNKSIKDKISYILEKTYKVLSLSEEGDESEGGVFMVVRYKNRERSAEEINPDDLYRVGEYWTDKELKIEEQIDENSIILKLFKGLKYDGDKGSIRSSLEYVYNGMINGKDEWKYRREVNGDGLNIISEFNYKNKFKNYFFLRISLISENREFVKGKVGISEFDQIPYALLCFCINPLSSDESTVTKGISPKYIRLLLLVRDELCDFIDYHLNNDSLQEYVSEEEKMKFNLQLKHGTEKYRANLETKFEILRKNLNRKNLKSLEYFVNYATNKMFLISNLNSSKEYLLNKKYNSQQIIKIIKNYSDFIFFDPHLNHSALINVEHLNLKFEDFLDFGTSNLVKGILEDAIFELLFNIRKHCITHQYLQISKDKVTVSVSIVEKNGIIFLKIMNNLCFSSPNQIIDLKSAKIDGLPLIYKIFKSTTNMDFEYEIDSINMTFSSFLPLKLLELNNGE